MEVSDRQPHIAAMNLRTSLLLLTLLAPAIDAAEAPEITVHLFDQAGVPERVLTQAVAVTNRIYAQGGIKLKWVAEPIPVAKPGEGVSFGQNASPVEVSLRLLPKRLSEGAVRSRSMLGLAIDRGAHGYRSLANVFYNRVESTAPGLYDVSVPELLGHVMAHELGHLLLGPNAHARGTIMACPWDSEDFRMLRHGQLRFTTEQVAYLREQVLGRGEAAKLRDTSQTAAAVASSRAGDPGWRRDVADQTRGK